MSWWVVIRGVEAQWVVANFPMVFVILLSVSLGKSACHKLALSWHISLFSVVTILRCRVPVINRMNQVFTVSGFINQTIKIKSVLEPWVTNELLEEIKDTDNAL